MFRVWAEVLEVFLPEARCAVALLLEQFNERPLMRTLRIICCAACLLTSAEAMAQDRDSKAVTWRATFVTASSEVAEDDTLSCLPVHADFLDQKPARVGMAPDSSGPFWTDNDASAGRKKLRPWSAELVVFVCDIIERICDYPQIALVVIIGSVLWLNRSKGPHRNAHTNTAKRTIY